MMYAGFRETEEESPMNDMTEKEILELCNADFSTKIDQMLNAAKRDFVRKVRSDVVDYIVRITVNQKERSRRSSVQSDKVPEARSRASIQEESVNEGEFTDEVIYEDNMILEDDMIVEEEDGNEIVDDFPEEILDENVDDFIGENLDDFMAGDSGNFIDELSNSGIIGEFDGTLPQNISPVEPQENDDDEFLGFGDSQAFD